MSHEPEIPILQDILYRGHPDTEKSNSDQSLDENKDFEIEQDEPESDSSDQSESQTDEIKEVQSIQELLIDEEIRMILDKHMDKAYEEIIRLLNHKLS